MSTAIFMIITWPCQVSLCKSPFQNKQLLESVSSLNKSTKQNKICSLNLDKYFSLDFIVNLWMVSMQHFFLNNVYVYEKESVETCLHFNKDWFFSPTDTLLKIQLCCVFVNLGLIMYTQNNVWHNYESLLFSLSFYI